MMLRRGSMLAISIVAMPQAPRHSAFQRPTARRGDQDHRGRTHDGLDIDINRKTNTVYTVWVGGNDGTGFALDMISAIDGKTDEIVATIGPGTIPSEWPWTSRRIWLTSPKSAQPSDGRAGPVVGGGGGTISVIDGATNTVADLRHSRRAPGSEPPIQRPSPAVNRSRTELR